MKDEISKCLSDLVAEISDAAVSLKGSVVIQSQQVAGTIAQRQELPLSLRISHTKDGANAQKMLEAAKSHTPTTEKESEIDENNQAVVDRYVDELVNKFLTSMSDSGR